MRKVIKIITIVVLLVAVCIYGINWAFFSIQRIDGQKQIREFESPSGEYTIVVYLNDGGATVDHATLCSVVNNETRKERNIYWEYHCTEADVQWVSDETAIINGIKLDVWEDIYDWRDTE